MADNAKYTPKQFADKIRGQNPAFGYMTDDQIIKIALQQKPEMRSWIMDTGPTSTGASFKAPATGVAREKEAVNTLARRGGEFVYENIPTAGATIGGIAGAGLGPWAAPVGAAGGGMIGKYLQRAIGASPEISGPKDRATALADLHNRLMSTDMMKDVTLEGARQGAFELAGLGMSRIGKAIFPTTRAQRIAFALGTGDMSPEVTKLLPDLDKAAIHLKVNPGSMTVGKIEEVAEQTGLNLENEFGFALAPINNIHFTTTDIANAALSKVEPHLLKTGEGRQIANEIAERAAEYNHKAWTVGEMNGERMRLAARRSAFERALPSEQAASVKTDATRIADNAIEDALKDKIYDLAEQSARRPPGYFTTLKQKESWLKDFRNAIAKRKKILMNDAESQAGAPWRERLRVHGHMNPMSGPSIGSYMPTVARDPLLEANVSLGKAFPGGTRRAVQYVREQLGESMRRTARTETEQHVPMKAAASPRQRALEREIKLAPARFLWEVQANADTLAGGNNEKASQ